MISVVIAGYNCSATIRATLDSVLAQETPAAEILFVNDGSTDETGQIVRTFRSVRLIEQENLGPGAARNTGVRYAQGEYIAFLDSDDLWLPWTLAVFEETIRCYGQPELIAAQLREFRNDAELANLRPDPLVVDAFDDYFASSGNRYFVGAGMMVVRRDAFERVGGFTNERIYAEDLDLAMRLGTGRGFAQILAPVTLGYRRHAASSRRNHRLIHTGMLKLIESERRGIYPGWSARARERRELITLFARPCSLDFLREERPGLGWHVFRLTFGWNLRQRRWKYLVGFLIRSVQCAIAMNRSKDPV